MKWNRINKFSYLLNKILLLIFFLAFPLAYSQGNCVEPPISDFTVTEITPGQNASSHISILDDGRIFYIGQWNGNVSLYTPGQGVQLLGTVPVNSGRHVEDGGLGIQADLNYDQTNWVYILHTPETLGSNRLTRYTITNNQITNPKIIFSYPRIVDPADTHDQRHAGGGMDWNVKTGHLWISTGDDTHHAINGSRWGPRFEDNPFADGQRTSGNSNDLRGKVLRIKPIPFTDSETPIPGIGATYEVPAGNLWDAFGPSGKQLWTADLQSKVRPEVFSMGHRNAYRVKADTATGWAYVGEVGPDGNNNDFDPAVGFRGADEINWIREPGNFGYPYFNGLTSYVSQTWDQGISAGEQWDPDNINNMSKNNTGVTKLPPATPALAYYNAGGSQTGPSSDLGSGGESAIMAGVYNYNEALNSSVKFPAYFHRKIFFAEYVRSQLNYLTTDQAGNLTQAKIFLTTTEGIQRNVDAHWDNDGSLVLLAWASGRTVRVSYTGTQYPATECTFIVEGCIDPSYTEYNPDANMSDGSCQTLPVSARIKTKTLQSQLISKLSGEGITIPLPDTYSKLTVYNMQGQLIGTANNSSFYLESSRPLGIYQVRYFK